MTTRVVIDDDDVHADASANASTTSSTSIAHQDADSDVPTLGTAVVVASPSARKVKSYFFYSKFLVMHGKSSVQNLCF